MSVSLATGRRRVVLVSDAALGFGSPQVPALAREIAAQLEMDPIILEPDVADSPPLHSSFPDLNVIRIRQKSPPIYDGGRSRYCREAAALIDDIKPDIVVIICTFSMPTLLHLKHKPSLVILYSIESIIQYGQPDILLNRELRKRIDLILWPEENRAKRDTERCGFEEIPSVLVLNSSNPQAAANSIQSIEQRSKRIIHQGTLGARHTYSQYFFDHRIYRLPIDVFGPIVDRESLEFEKFRNTSYATPASKMIYHGRIDLQRLAWFRRRSAFLVTIWSPADERGLYAPSNKFFEAIADGVPPITAPHPQHVRLVKKYDCGLLMEDWSFEAFRYSLVSALRIFGTARHRQLIENCRRAVREELNVELQMGAAVAKIRELYETKVRQSFPKHAIQKV